MNVATLFCGGGLETAGKVAALESLGLTPARSIAVNHWDVAVATHAALRHTAPMGAQPNETE